MLLIAVVLGFVTTVLYSLKLRRVIRHAPRLRSPSTNPTVESLPTVAVVVPAYNEAKNVEGCLRSLLDSTPLPLETLEVWLVDDQSTDDTWAIAQSLQHSWNDPRLKLLAGKPRPAGETWVGKNWACVQAAALTQADYLLFLDADMRLKPGAIETAVTTAIEEKADLLSCAPAIVCGCWAEWLVQPLMVGVLLTGFPYDAVNDPQSKVAFATGPFMLFRRTAYEAIGGHRAVASQVVEDVELARCIKSSGFVLHYRLGTSVASVRMYESWGSLWEGWTKNLYLGCQRNLKTITYLAIAMMLSCTVPWLAVLWLGIKAVLVGLTWTDGVTIALALLSIALHYDLRRVEQTVTDISLRYWWLTGIGGVLIAAIAIGSAIKTETGWGWTWRGRSLWVASAPED